jgi:bifunctional DNA-binding transcriptional regulator/antitoxin component of YhaV-PrlF toxin-antitoxin module
MSGLSRRRVLGNIDSGLRMTFPTAWARALGVKPGDSLEALYDDVLVVIPRPGRQADRVRRALAEDG